MRLQMRIKPSRHTRLHLPAFERVAHYNNARDTYRDADGIRVEARDPEYTHSRGKWFVIVDRGSSVDVLSKRFNSLGEAETMMKTLRRQGFACVANREAQA